MVSKLLPRLLDLRANATTVEIHELADILVEMLERQDALEQKQKLASAPTPSPYDLGASARRRQR